MAMTAVHSTERRYAAVVALIGWSALALQFWLSLRFAITAGHGALWGVVMYFGYFTILTNILAATALSAPLVAPGSRFARFSHRPSVVSGIATAILLVGIAYFLLLRHIWNPQGWQWLADVLLHYVMPIAFATYWWLAVPAKSVRWADIPSWTLYPIAYLAYALARGELIGIYSYYFIDVAALGYERTLVNALGVLAGFLALGAMLVAISRLRR